MVKSVILDDYVHRLLTDKQSEIHEKYKVKINISDVAAIAIQIGINGVDIINIAPHKQQERIEDNTKKLVDA